MPAGEYVIKASFVGYESIEKKIEVLEDMDLDLILIGSIFQLDRIDIMATTAKKENPITFSSLDREKIEESNIAQDVPYMLRWMPSVTVTSDAGAGIGYTGIRVRGTESSRTNVTINGVPLNDSESQGVFWVNMPDLLSNVEDIQVQRGVGVSTNGTSAFGATVHMNTQTLKQNSFAILTGGIGSYNTKKASVHLGTGLMNNMYSVEGRYSIIKSGGYIDRASSDLSSYYFSAARVDDRSSLRLNVFSGGEVTYQAWNGLPYTFLENNRTYNSSGTEKQGEPYDNEVDNYRQTHGQLIYKREVGQNGVINLTGHITQGAGFFENYKADKFNKDFNLPDDTDTVRQDIVIQRWLDNLFYGLVYSYEYDKKNLNIIVGGGLNQYNGEHFGDVVWQQLDTSANQKAIRYYTNRSRKREGNIYVRLNYNIKNVLFPFVDLQYRALNYRYLGPDDNGEVLDITDNKGFFNPKVGLSYIPNKSNKLFAYYGVANREPSRSEYRESTPANRPSHETLMDIELGYNHSSKYIDADFTFFNMDYKDQLVPTGKLGDTGEPIRTNVDASFRRGIEFGLLAKFSKRVQAGYYGTFSQNKIENFTEFVDVWDDGSQTQIEHKNTDIAYSPNQLHTIVTKFHLLPVGGKHNLAAQANFKYVGSQFLDNTSSEFAQLDGFSFLDMQFNYSTSFMKVKKVAVTFQLNNVLNNLYVSNGWVYRFQSEGFNPTEGDSPNPYARLESGNQYNQTGYYPQATRNVLLGIRFEF